MNDTEISYKLFFKYLHPEIQKVSKSSQTIPIHTKILKNYINNIYQSYNILDDKQPIVKELFVLYQISKCLEFYNNNVLKLSRISFRSTILYPNIIYILIRFMSNARKFLSDIIKWIYGETCQKSYGIIKVHVNTFYLDEDVIKYDMLYNFLGNGLRKFNPLEIDDVTIFYKSIFRNILYYYLKTERRVCSSYTTFWDIDKSIVTSTRDNIYREVLLKLEINEFYNNSPTLKQMSYNFNIFRNVIINNEFQNLYISSSKIKCLSKDNHYKLVSVYENDILNEVVLKKIKEIPIIYKLLKCVHILSISGRPYDEGIISPELVKSAILGELLKFFRNLFSDQYLLPILDKISWNFTNSILSGEYINLLSLSDVKINQLSFIKQVCQFVRLCLDHSIKEK